MTQAEQYWSIISYDAAKAVESIDEMEFISVPEWGRRLGVSKEAAYAAGRRNEIPGLFRIGRLVRVNWRAFMTATGRSEQQ